MKKLLIVLALASVSMVSMAQDTTDPTLKYSVATNSFWSNWFIQVGAQWNAWYSSEEHGYDLDKSPVKGFRSNPGAAIAIGKWFTPGLGLRTKLQGIWGKSVRGPEGTDIGNKYWILNEHILFNLSNMLLGYNPNRVWNFIPFAGGGVGRTMTHNLYAMDLSAGILNEFRLSKKVLLNLELGWNRLESDIDGGEQWTDGHRGWDSHDNNFYAELGLTFNLGKSTWDKVPDVDAIKALSQQEIDALRNQLNDANAENARLRDMLANQKPVEEKAVTKYVGAPVSVYFNINKTDEGPSYEADLNDVKGLVEIAKENNSNLLVTGYADSATGSVERNQWLSEHRAEQVANEIVNMGFDRDKIETAAKGGVAILSPINLDRRATVEIK